MAGGRLAVFVFLMFIQLAQGYFTRINDLKDEIQSHSKILSTELVHLSTENHPCYNFTVFGEDVKLNLKRNTNIVSKFFKTIVRGAEKSWSEMVEPIKDCYFSHRDEASSGALSLCRDDQMHGLIFFDKYFLEISPANLHVESDRNNSGTAHIVRKALISNLPWIHDVSRRKTIKTKRDVNNSRNEEVEERFRLTDPVIEAALFFDEAAYKVFAPYFKYDDLQIRDMLLAYINGVQALFHQPSLGRRVDLVLSRLEIFTRQPSDLPTGNGGEREKLLDSFCEYSQRHNPSSDEDPQHWDIGLYLSGLDFYAIENGRKSGVTMGLAVVGGICQAKYSCLIAEFGATNVFGKPYPSAGFTSVFILAHEIGHSLGMHHDSYGNSCPKDGYIMSPSRGVVGETIWSSCSATVLNDLRTWARCLYDDPDFPPDLDHRKYRERPGTVWNQKRQCELLLKDQDAVPLASQQPQEICKNLHCRSPHRSGLYFAGPPIQGTHCAEGKWCQDGACVKRSEDDGGDVIEGGWTGWSTGPCQSGCILKSKGSQRLRRRCSAPAPRGTERGCEGLSYHVQTCNDTMLCDQGRRTAEDYASWKCAKFAQYVTDIDDTGDGLQAPHEQDRLWVGCAIFCKRRDGNSYYTPRVELNDVGLNPYFPDGTWCHLEGKTNFYCLQHHCLPENFDFTKNILLEDDFMILQNAPPNLMSLPENLRKYLSTDLKGNPLLRILNPDLNFEIPEDEWSSKDYIEIP